MGGIRLFIHPLFFAFGFYYALTGRAFVFVVCTLTAVVHELGHSFSASNSGYKLNRITLMPFGAVVKGDIEGLKLSDEIKVALAGPFINIAIGLFFIALWWLFPETYAFTDIVVEANLSMAAINLLPIFPLDGGRVLGALLKSKIGTERGDKICSAVSVVGSLLFIAAFVYSLFNTINLSLLFFALFVLIGAFGKGKNNKYVRIYGCFSERRLKNGLEVKTIAVDKSVNLKKIMNLLDENSLNEVDVYEGKNKVAHLSFKKISELLEKGDIYSPIGKFI